MLDTPRSPAIDAVPTLPLLPEFDIEPRASAQVETVREMVRGLDLLTAAGQRHVMAKVADFIAAELRRRRAESGQRARSLARTLGRIAREPARLAPAVRPFARRAEILLALLQVRTV